MAYNLVIKEIPENRDKYISLAEGADYSGYSQDYLRFRVRQGKLRAAKVGRNWLTTTEWLDEYLQKVADYKETAANPEKKIQRMPIVSLQQAEPPTDLEEVAPEEGKEPAPEETEVNTFVPTLEPEFQEEQKVAVVANPIEEKPSEQPQEPRIWDLGWLKYGLAFICLFGVLGFTIGLAYPYLTPALRAGRSLINDSLAGLTEKVVAPLLPEQFAASFGLIYREPNAQPNFQFTPAEREIIDSTLKLIEARQKIEEYNNNLFSSTTPTSSSDRIPIDLESGKVW